MPEQVLRRPASVTAAGWIAIVASVLTAGYLVLALADGLEAAGDTLAAGLVVGLVWCAVAVVLAALALRGSAAAAIVLGVSAAVAGSFSLTASAYLAGAFLTLVACVATIVLLLSGSSRQWLRGVRTD